MLIAGCDIKTPYDEKICYSMAWRHEAAMAMSEGETTSQVIADDDVRAQLGYLNMVEDEFLGEVLSEILLDPSSTASTISDLAEANKIYSQTGNNFIRERIDALLLCPELSYEDIGNYYRVTGNTIKYYEKIFFNIRDDHGRVRGEKGLVEYCALQDSPKLEEEQDYAKYWKVVAFESGAKGLFAIWGWPVGGEIPELTEVDLQLMTIRQAYKQLDARYKFTHMDSKALTTMFAEISRNMGELREKGLLSDSDVITDEHLMLKILELISPERAAVSESLMDSKQQQLTEKLEGMRAKEGKGEEANTSASIEGISKQMADKT